MSKQTLDNLIYDMNSTDEQETKPFLKKDWLYCTDTNLTGNYTTNSIEFSTMNTFASNGRLPNPSEGYIMLPWIIAIQNTTSPNLSWSSTTTDQHFADCCLALKNSSVQLINSISIDWGNGNVVQPIPYLNSYLSFIQHSEFSSEDEFLNGPTIMYAKDSSTSWGYNATNTAGTATEGCGYFNNVSSIQGLPKSAHFRDVVNTGMMRRQSYFQRTDESAGKSLVFGGDDIARGRLGCNSIVNYEKAKVYYCSMIIRLKDLPFFKNVPMSRGMNIRMVLTLNNNVSFNFSKSATGDLVFANFSNISGLTNPIMVASNSHKYRDVVGSANNGAIITANNRDASGNIIGATLSSSITEKSLLGGSSCLDNLQTYLVSSGLGSLTLDGVSYNHSIRQCRLYMPCYTPTPSFASLYFDNPKRVVSYNDLFFTTFNVNKQEGGAQFFVNLTNGIAYAKRLIICPYMNGSTSGGNYGEVNPFSVLSSPFSDAPSCVSPCIVNNFNVAVGGINIYPNPILWSYEQFKTEMDGQFALNGNQISGSCASRISLQDYINNYGYIVINLNRKLDQDESVLSSIAVSGTLLSQKDMSFYCFIEYTKKITIDVSDGTRVA